MSAARLTAILALILAVLALTVEQADAQRQRGKFVKEKQQPKIQEQGPPPTKEDMDAFAASITNCEDCVSKQPFGWDLATKRCGTQFSNKQCTQKATEQKATRSASSVHAEAAELRRKPSDDEDVDEDEIATKLNNKRGSTKHSVPEDDDEEEDAESDEDEDEQPTRGKAYDADDTEIETEQQPRMQLELDEQWRNTEITTSIWQTISQGNEEHFLNMLTQEPRIAKVRSQDGRGPLFWAYEFRRTALIEPLLQAGADPEAKDAHEQTARDMAV
jgi:hypothetical protein